MNEIVNVVFGWGLQALLLSAPGATVAFLMGPGLMEGRKAAILASVGLALGSFVAAIGTILVAALLFARSDLLLAAGQFFSAGFLGLLAWQAFQRYSQRPPPPRAITDEVPLDKKQQIIRAIRFQFSQWKTLPAWFALVVVAGLYQVSIFAGAIFVFGALMISFVAHCGWGYILNSPKKRVFYQKNRHWFEASRGAMFCFAVLTLAIKRIG